MPKFLSRVPQSDMTDSSHSQTWSALDTPAHPSINEIELAATNLYDGEHKAVDVGAPMDAIKHNLPPQSHLHPVSVLRLPHPHTGFSVVPEDILNLDV
ncbi:hypothetical protein V8E53_010420 [Lactarius tabidus]